MPPQLMRQREAIVEAYKLGRDTCGELMAWFGDSARDVVIESGPNMKISATLDYKNMTYTIQAVEGDWIVKNSHGIFLKVIDPVFLGAYLPLNY